MASIFFIWFSPLMLGVFDTYAAGARQISQLTAITTPAEAGNSGAPNMIAPAPAAIAAVMVSAM
ncbi:MAG: hypothetical protein WA409_05835 [Candidatus Binatus sp.]